MRPAVRLSGLTSRSCRPIAAAGPELRAALPPPPPLQQAAPTSRPRHSFVSARGYASHPSTHPSKPPRQGQPLHHTHPHLVGSGELTPGIPASEYEERRRKLMESLPEGSVVVCMGGTVRLVSQRELHNLSYWNVSGRYGADVAEILWVPQSSTWTVRLDCCGRTGYTDPAATSSDKVSLSCRKLRDQKHGAGL